MNAKNGSLFACLAIVALNGCGKTSDNPKPAASNDVVSDDLVAKADAHTKLIALRGPQWTKPDLTYALSVCWRFASGVNIDYGRGTCALVMEELELPIYSIDFATKNPMACCYTAGQSALMRMQEITKVIEGGQTALDAIAGYNSENPQYLTVMNEEFADCKGALPGLKRDVEFMPVSDYATQASKLMPGRRKREAMEELSTASSLIWPDERVEQKARAEAGSEAAKGKAKVDAQRAIAELRN